MQVTYPKKKKTSSLRRWAMYLGISLMVGGTGYALLKDNTLKPGKIMTTPTTLEPEKIMTTPTEPNTSLDFLIDQEFNCPIHLEIRNEREGTVAYVLDGTGKMYRFGKYSHVGHYLPPGTSGNRCAQYLEKFPTESRFKGRVPFYVGNGFVSVDNLDGTIIFYTIPYMNFIERKKGKYTDDCNSNCFLTEKKESEAKIVCTKEGEAVPEYRIVFRPDGDIHKEIYSLEDDYCDDTPCKVTKWTWQKSDERNDLQQFACELGKALPHFFTYYRDAPSIFSLNATEFLPILDLSSKSIDGRCRTLPLLAFERKQDASGRIIFGYTCPNGEFEEYEFFENPLDKTPIAAAASGKDIYLIFKDHQKVLKIELNNPGLK